MRGGGRRSNPSCEEREKRCRLRKPKAEKEEEEDTIFAWPASSKRFSLCAEMREKRGRGVGQCRRAGERGKEDRYVEVPVLHTTQVLS